ncbi:SRPBCC family protein [Nocardioides sp. SR21]|uniref:SRPBCC family protein n=1 Tax=Nocardioides sp. SR21 TaxID=2919501 RepID=UPI001FA96581|nr:SRPBCC family protein [Nocardioides sp. SR21]
MTQPTGRIETRDGVLHLVIERTFRAPIDDVWAAVTEPERMARWIGTWTGDSATRRVHFRMLFEGGDPDDAGEEVDIRECDPPRRLAVTTHAGGQSWQLELDLSEADGVTTLVFTQPAVDGAEAENVGPGWEYYLDRLVRAESGGDPAEVDFERDYYPAMQEHYRAQVTG